MSNILEEKLKLLNILIEQENWFSESKKGCCQIAPEKLKQNVKGALRKRFYPRLATAPFYWIYSE